MYPRAKTPTARFRCSRETYRSGLQPSGVSRAFSWASAPCGCYSPGWYRTSLLPSNQSVEPYHAVWVLEVAAAFHGAGHSDFVGVFDVASGGDAGSDIEYADE